MQLRLLAALAFVSILACSDPLEPEGEWVAPPQPPALKHSALAATPRWVTTGAMSTSRSSHTLTLLPTGKVLVAGGKNSSGASLTSAQLYDPTTGAWSATGSMAQYRYNHTATLLPNGKVLVAGGYDNPTLVISSAQVYDPATGTWRTTGSFSQARAAHTATLLPDGKVLVVGGRNTSVALSSAQLYDPATGTWSATGSLSQARSHHTATLLPDGKVLVVGGRASAAVGSAELYDPVTGTWSATGSLPAGMERYHHVATLLPTGKVLVASGRSTGNLYSAYLYDPGTGTWSAARSPFTQRDMPSATLLPDGKVLVVGGRNNSDLYLDSAEMYDSATGFWSPVAPMSVDRAGATAVLLPNGNVLVTGGAINSPSAELFTLPSGVWTATGSLPWAYGNYTVTLLQSGKVLAVSTTGTSLYDPATGTWGTTGWPAYLRHQHTATLLRDGRVLIAGGTGGSGALAAEAELYHPTSGVWSRAGRHLQPRAGHTATLLPDGRVLLSGGSSSGSLATAEVFDPSTETWSATGAMAQRRSDHEAVLLPQGKVLVCGGRTDNTSLQSAELYDPASGTWSATGSMVQAHSSHTATLLPQGKVLVAGGNGDTGILATAEVYDPVSGTWSSTGTLVQYRTSHMATRLSGGKVLVAGGHQINSITPSAEVYDPASGTWSETGSLLQGRAGVAALLLADGRVLIVGGGPSSSSPTTAEVYEDSGSPPAWRPSISSLTPSGALIQQSPFTVTGLRFRGVSEASSGPSQTSPTDFPLLTLVDPEQRVTRTVPFESFSSTQVTATVPDVPTNHYMLFVTVNGLTTGQMVQIGNMPETVITSAPASLSTTSGATFTFTGDAGATFLCSVDSGAIHPCTSPASYTLFDGQHTFKVRARTPDGYVDPTPAVFSWRIDLTPPSTYLYLYPPASTRQTTATFQASCSEPACTYECRLDAASYAPCTWPLTYSDLTEGVHTFQARATDAAGHQDSSGVSYTWTIDLTEPDTSIFSSPPSPSNQTAPSFTFSANEQGTTFGCSLDGAAFSPCTSPVSYTGLTEGEHTFQVRATDAATNLESTPASYSWTIDLTVPDTFLISSPPNPSNQTAPSFTFSSNEGGTTYECRLDAASYAPCTSPHTYSNLAELVHTFRVRARDAAGNLDPSEVVYTWATDLTPPDTTLTSAPPAQTPQTSATFTFSSEGGASFECSLDGAAFSACTSPAPYNNLAQGSHSFQVRARDVAGNADPTPASHTWTVTPGTLPDTTLTAGPPLQSNSTSATFTFSSNVAGARFECSLDGAAFSTCTSPTPYSNLAQGQHTFQVRAQDSAGNVDPSPASYTWTIAQPSGVDTSLTQVPASPTAATSATFAFTSNLAGASFECSLDNGLFALCSSPALTASLADGSHTFQVRARDAAGNVDTTPATHTWTVDTVAPETLITAAPTEPTTQPSALFTFTSEPGSSFECSLDGAAYTACTSPHTYTNLAPGRHSFLVRARDAVGNVEATPASHSWTLDQAPPAAPVIRSPTQGATVTDPRPTLSGSAEPGSTVTLTLDGAVAGTVTADPAGTWLFTPASELSDGEHSVFATATGAGGTSLASTTVRFIVDTADEPAAPQGSGCSAGPGDASWMLASMLLLAGLAARRRRGWIRWP